MPRMFEHDQDGRPPLQAFQVCRAVPAGPQLLGESFLAAGAGATAICSPTGPFALACEIFAAAVTWVTVDTVGIKIDEKLHRKQMKKGMIETIEKQKKHMAVEMKQSHYDYIDSVMSHINEDFVPIRDGM